MNYKLFSLRVAFIARVTSYFYYTSYALILHTSYYLLFIARVTRYVFHPSYEFMFIALVTRCYLYASYELLFIARSMSFFKGERKKFSKTYLT